MPAPRNRLKAALARGELQVGLWLGMTHSVSAEIAAGAGFDWCLIDAEHSPNTLPEIRAQLQAMAGGSASPVVRVPQGEPWIVKQVLDLGVQSVLVPMTDTATQARRMVQAMRYPPEGVRGVGAGLARASGYGGIDGYVSSANDQMCLLVQAESREAIENIDEIAGTDGVDGVFVGPADLSASMGHLGHLDAPEVVEAIDHAIDRIRAAGKAAGIIDFDPAAARRWAGKGVTFLGVGSDVTTLARGLRALAAEMKG